MSVTSLINDVITVAELNEAQFDKNKWTYSLTKPD